MSQEALTFSRLEDAEEVSGFQCKNGPGAVDLEDFLKNNALDYERRNLSRSYLGWLDDELVGFVTLSCGSLRIRPEAAALQAKAEIEDIPCVIPGVLLGRLAVDDRFQGSGFGPNLFRWSVYLAREQIAPMAGCRFLFIDAYVCRRTWYEARGCSIADKTKQNPTDTMKMCFDLFPPEDPTLDLWKP